MSADNQQESNRDENNVILQLLLGRLESHFDLIVKFGLLQNKLYEYYTDKEIEDIINICNELDSKLNDQSGNYRLDVDTINSKNDSSETTNQPS